MIIFKVVERVLGVGPRKGQKAYCAEPKAPNKFSSTWPVERIVRDHLEEYAEEIEEWRKL